MGETERPIPGQERGVSLRSNFAWTFAGNGIYAACQWAVLVLLAKLGSPEWVGKFALGLAVSAPVFLFSNLKLRAVQATDQRYERTFSDYWTLRLATSLFAFAVVTVLALLVGQEPEQRRVIIAIGVAKAVESVSDVLYGLAQQHERMRAIAISMSLKGTLSVGAMAAAIWVTESVLWGAIALAGSWAVVLVVYDIPMGLGIVRAREGRVEAATLRPTGDFRGLSRLAFSALPLGIVVMLGSLFVNVPRYFIEHHLGTKPLGLYAAIASLMVAGNMVVNALGQAASPRLAKHHANGDRPRFRRLLFRLLLLGALLGVAGLLVVAVAGRLALQVLYTSEYAVHVDVLAWLMIAQAVNYLYVFVGTSINAMRKFWVQLPIHAASIAAMTVLCALLVPSHGMTGAAWAVLGSTLFEGALYAAVAHRLYAGWRAQLVTGGAHASASVAEGA